MIATKQRKKVRAKTEARKSAPPEQTTVVRTTLVKLNPDPAAVAYLDHHYTACMERAAVYHKTLLACRGVPVDVRTPHGDVPTPPDKLHYVSDPARGKRLYQAALQCNKSRTLRNPLILKGCRTGHKSAKPVEQELRKLIAVGFLPLLDPADDLSSQYDYAAIESALSSLKSWDDRNNATEANYRKQEQLVAEMTPSLEHQKLLQDWIARNKAANQSEYITSKVAKKFARFGWDTRLRQYPWDKLKALNGDPAFWLNLFKWHVEKSKLERLRPTAAFTFPHPDASPRLLPLGSNYERFALQLDNDRLVLTVGDHTIPAFRTRYFSDLTLTRKNNGNIDYTLTYRRGNRSPLNEDVVADLKEVMLFRKKGHYYLALPCNVHVPTPAPEASALFSDYCKYREPDAWPEGMRVVGVDLGVNQPASCVTAVLGEALHTYSLVTGAEEILGTIRDVKCFNLVKKCRKDIRDAHDQLSDLARSLVENNLTPFTPEWVGETATVGAMIQAVKRTIRQLKRYDLYTRNRGVTSEAMQYILMYKEYIGLLHRWSSLGLPPLPKGAKKPWAFQAHYRYLDAVRKDFRKKVACEIIRYVRRMGGQIVVIEDLEHFKPDEELASSTNELLMLWGKGQIINWIKHFAKQYGIVVVTVDPRHTSQIDHETGLFGVRDPYDKSILHVERDVHMCKIHADLNAAANIAGKFITFGASVASLMATPVVGGHMLYKTDDPNTGKRVKYVLKSLFGSLKVFVDGNGVARKCGKRREKTGADVWLYRYPDGWQTRAEHYRRKDALAARAGVVKRTAGRKPAVSNGRKKG